LVGKKIVRKMEIQIRDCVIACIQELRTKISSLNDDNTILPHPHIGQSGGGGHKGRTPPQKSQVSGNRKAGEEAKKRRNYPANQQNRSPWLGRIFVTN
jgi:hypothetical protein